MNLRERLEADAVEMNACAGGCECANFDGIEHDLREAAAALAERGWRLIESAPKDGTPLLLFAPEDAEGPAVYVIGTYDSLHRQWIEESDRGQVELSHPDAYRLWCEANITHWQPLPPPPESTNDR